MNSVIIQRPLLRNKHVICPQNEFYDLLCNRTPLVSSEGAVPRQLLCCFPGRDLYFGFHEARFFCVYLISLLILNASVLSVLSVLVCTFKPQQQWCVFVRASFLCVCIFMDALLPAQIWRLVAHSFEGWQNLRGRLKYCAVIGIALSSVSSINVQFSI